MTKLSYLIKVRVIGMKVPGKNRLKPGPLIKSENVIVWKVVPGPVDPVFVAKPEGPVDPVFVAKPEGPVGPLDPDPPAATHELELPT